MIRAIIFDLWSTVLAKGTSISGTLHQTFNIRRYPGFVKRYERAIQLRKWSSRKAEAHALLRKFCIQQTPGNMQVMTKAITRAVQDAYPNQGMRALLAKLGRKYKLGLLSNTSYWERKVMTRTGIQKYFDSVVFSFEIKSLKPARKPYLKVMDKLRIRPQECIFIDDTAENIHGAKKLGMHAIQYKNTAQITRELRKRGIL